MVDSYIHHEISFGDDDGDDDGVNESLSVILDEEYNDGATSFAVNTPVGILVLYSDDGYVTDHSYGTLLGPYTGVDPEMTDTITFAFSDSGTLSHVPSDTPSWQWIGNSQGTPAFDGKNVTLLSEETGILEVTYHVAGDRFILTSSSAIDIVVAAYQAVGELKASLTVSITDATTLGGPYILTVKDYCTDVIIVGAQVWVDSVYVGESNVAGQVALGMMTQGQHTVSITHGDYLSSDSDHLNNDGFTVTVTV